MSRSLWRTLLVFAGLMPGIGALISIVYTLILGAWGGNGPSLSLFLRYTVPLSFFLAYLWGTLPAALLGGIAYGIRSLRLPSQAWIMGLASFGIGLISFFVSHLIVGGGWRDWDPKSLLLLLIFLLIETLVCWVIVSYVTISQLQRDPDAITNWSIFRTILIFIGLGPPIGVLVGYFAESLYALSQNRVIGLGQWPTGILLAVTLSYYVLNLFPAAVAGAFAYLFRILKPQYGLAAMALVGVGLGEAYPFVTNLIFYRSLTDGLDEWMFIHTVPSCLIATLVCWTLVSWSRLSVGIQVPR